MDALAHRMGNPCACRVEGIVYIEPYYRPIIYTPVSVGSAVVGDKLTLNRVISHVGRGWWFYYRSEPSRNRLIIGKFRTVADIIESPSTTVNDIKTTDADAVSPVSMSVYTSNDVLDVPRTVWRASQTWIP